MQINAVVTACTLVHAVTEHSRTHEMEIIVEPISGEPFIVTVNRYLTIFSLKLKLQRILGLPISQMILVHNHQELGDDNTLCEYGIITGSRIQLLVSMKGGPVHAKRMTLLTSQEDSAQSAQDSDDDYYNRLTILLVDGDSLNVIQMGADSGDWDNNGFAVSNLYIHIHEYSIYSSVA